MYLYTLHHLGALLILIVLLLSTIHIYLAIKKIGLQLFVVSHFCGRLEQYVHEDFIDLSEIIRMLFVDFLLAADMSHNIPSDTVLIFAMKRSFDFSNF